MTGAILGRWANAPLAYVLAQVRFEEILDIEKRLPDFQGRLREQFPRFSNVVIPGGLSQLLRRTIEQWEFQNESRNKGVRIDAGSLALTATYYVTFDQFAVDLEKIITAFFETVKTALVTRIGVRYIDFILPTKDQRLEDYVVSPLNQTPKINFEGKVTTASNYEYDLDGEKLIIKYSAGEGMRSLPLELLPLTLEKAEIMNRSHAGPAAILDMDCMRLFKRTVDASTLMANFHSIHKNLSSAFGSIISDHAKKEWNSK